MNRKGFSEVELLVAVVAVVLAFGSGMYLGSRLSGTYSGVSATGNPESFAPNVIVPANATTIDWNHTLALIKGCRVRSILNGPYCAYNPVLTLDNGQSLKISDHPGFLEISQTVQNLGLQCLSIPEVSQGNGSLCDQPSQ